MSQNQVRRAGQPYDPAFKVRIVQELLQGERSQEEIRREHHLSRPMVWRWKKAYARYGEAAFTSVPKGRPKLPEESGETKALPRGVQARIAELERLCGRLMLENELLKKVSGRVPWDSDTP